MKDENKNADSTPAQCRAGAAPLAGHSACADAAQGSAERVPGASPAVSSAIPPRPDWLKPVKLRKQPRSPEPFDVFRSATDEESFGAPAPECAELRESSPGSLFRCHFVPVSFVAKDWKVTPRRIRALLAGGRLAGRLQENGYWEVRFPYSFTFGTRGPGLKRQQKQERMAA